MGLPINLPVGTVYLNKDGTRLATHHEAKLIYWWGAKGHCGMDAQPRYMVPILGGHVCIYLTPDQIVG